MRGATRTLVTGASGLLGTSLVPYLKIRGFHVITLCRSGRADIHADLNNYKQTNSALNKAKPEVIINLAALTSVDECERNLQAAYLANVRIVEHIARWIRRHGNTCHLIHLSTDQVYDGKGSHKENDIVLSNYYAFSKYAGELAAALVPSTVLRTNFIGLSKTSSRVSLTDWIFASLKNGENIKVLNDVFFSPLSMTTLSEMICLVIEKCPIGVFNLGSHNGMNKADFAFYFAECLGLQTKTMTRANVDQVSFMKTYRPKDMRLDCTKFEETMQLALPDLRDEIQLVVEDYRESSKINP